MEKKKCKLNKKKQNSMIKISNIKFKHIIIPFNYKNKIYY